MGGPRECQERSEDGLDGAILPTQRLAVLGAVVAFLVGKALSNGASNAQIVNCDSHHNFDDANAGENANGFGVATAMRTTTLAASRSLPRRHRGRGTAQGGWRTTGKRLPAPQANQRAHRQGRGRWPALPGSRPRPGRVRGGSLVLPTWVRRTRCRGRRCLRRRGRRRAGRR